VNEGCYEGCLRDGMPEAHWPRSGRGMIGRRSRLTDELAMDVFIAGAGLAGRMVIRRRHKRPSIVAAYRIMEHRGVTPPSTKSMLSGFFLNVPVPGGGFSTGPRACRSTAAWALGRFAASWAGSSADTQVGMAACCFFWSLPGCFPDRYPLGPRPRCYLARPRKTIYGPGCSDSGRRYQLAPRRGKRMYDWSDQEAGASPQYELLCLGDGEPEILRGWTEFGRTGSGTPGMLLHFVVRALRRAHSPQLTKDL